MKASIFPITPKYIFISVFYFLLAKLFQFVDNKPKGRISKPVFQENKARQIFWRADISYSLIRTYVCI